MNEVITGTHWRDSIAAARTTPNRVAANIRRGLAERDMALRALEATYDVFRDMAAFGREITSDERDRVLVLVNRALDEMQARDRNDNAPKVSL